MRNAFATSMIAVILTVSAFAQTPALGPNIIAPPPMLVIPPTLPATPPSEPLPAPLDAFGVGALPGTIVSPPGVRPPSPVSEAPIEVPPGPMFWANFDYLLWRSKGGLMPPLVVAIGGPAALAVPIDPRWAVPISDDRSNGGLQSGFRLGGGMWLDKPHGTGVEAVYTMFVTSSDVASYNSVPNVVLGRLLVDVTVPAVALYQLSTPSGSTQGLAQVRTSFDADGFELNVLRRGPAMIGEEFHWILGVRYFGLKESLTIESLSQASGLRVGAFDTFATDNHFVGAQFGGRWNWNIDRLSIDFLWKLAVGGMNQAVDINGDTGAALSNGASIERPGGLLALSSNIGDYDRTKLVAMRDATLNIGYAITSNVRINLGYNLMWVSSVIRPGEQIDLGVNPKLLPFSGLAPSAPARPSFQFKGDEFWMHGINVGLSVQF
jgi:hypothetical protein